MSQFSLFCYDANCEQHIHVTDSYDFKAISELRDEHSHYAQPPEFYYLTETTKVTTYHEIPEEEHSLPENHPSKLQLCFAQRMANGTIDLIFSFDRPDAVSDARWNDSAFILAEDPDSIENSKPNLIVVNVTAENSTLPDEKWENGQVVAQDCDLSVEGINSTGRIPWLTIPYHAFFTGTTLPEVLSYGSNGRQMLTVNSVTGLEYVSPSLDSETPEPGNEQFVMADEGYEDLIEVPVDDNGETRRKVLAYFTKEKCQELGCTLSVEDNGVDVVFEHRFESDPQFNGSLAIKLVLGFADADYVLGLWELAGKEGSYSPVAFLGKGNESTLEQSVLDRHKSISTMNPDFSTYKDAWFDHELGWGGTVKESSLPIILALADKCQAAFGEAGLGDFAITIRN